jgi:phosphate transport system substrate-binding protein
MALFAGPEEQELAKTDTSRVIQADGSSTVYPITWAISELYQLHNTDRKVEVATSGTSSGFKLFSSGKIHINNASRQIRPKELANCMENNIQILEIPVAYDGICILVNQKNDFISDITLEELQGIWKPGSSIERWSDIRPEWPNTKVSLYGPSSQHGTYDFFTEIVNGKTGSCRDNYIAEDDYNKLINDIAEDRNAMGFVSYAFYVKNVRRVKALSIIAEDGAAMSPNFSNILSQKYALSRKLYIYASKSKLASPAFEDFLKFYMNTAYAIVRKVGYVPLTKEMYRMERENIEMMAAEVKSTALSTK